MDFAVEGLDTINFAAIALEQLPYHLNEEVHIAALKKAAKPLAYRMELLAPEDTGLMASEIVVRKTRFKRLGEHQVIVGPKKVSGGHGFLAHMHEYGTVNMRARPFMRPAYEQTKALQEQIYTTEIQSEVDKRLNGL